MEIMLEIIQPALERIGFRVGQLVLELLLDTLKPCCEMAS